MGDFLNSAIGVACIIIFSIGLFFILAMVFYRQFFKRFFDMVFSGILLVVLSPLFLILTMIVLIKLGRPIIFKQLRPGKNNKIFCMHKFRTMTNEKDECGILLSDEKRITTFGKFLRSTSLDELPEIWDIFRGKMSFIGPRPQLVQDLVFMDENTKRRHCVRGGLTGLAQIKGRNNINWPERFNYDLFYVDNYNLCLDIKIFFITIFKVLSKEDINTDGTVTSFDYGDELLNECAITLDEYESNQEKAKILLNQLKAKNSHK